MFRIFILALSFFLISVIKVNSDERIYETKKYLWALLCRGN